jgi:hypothetical protein
MLSGQRAPRILLVLAFAAPGACGGEDTSAVSSQPEGEGILTLDGVRWRVEVERCEGDGESSFELRGRVLGAAQEGQPRQVDVDRTRDPDAGVHDQVEIVLDIGGGLAGVTAESRGETLFQADRHGVDSPAVTFRGDSVVNDGQELRGAIEATCP